MQLPNETAEILNLSPVFLKVFIQKYSKGII